MSLDFKLFIGQEGFSSIKESWLALAEECGTHFLHFPAWYAAELSSRTDSSNIYFVTVCEAKQLIAVLPFERAAIKKKFIRTPVLRIFFQNEMGVNDVISRRPLASFHNDLIQFLRLNLPYFALVQWQCILASGYAISAGLSCRNSHASKYLDLSNGQDAFWGTYNKKFVRNVRRKERKAQEQGELNLVVVNQIEQLSDAFNQFLEVESSGWKGEQGTSIAQQPIKCNFYEVLMAEFGERAQINLLYLNDECIAAQFAIRISSTLYLLKIGFKEEYSSISPGTLILTKLIDEFAELASIKRISFVTGVGWIDSWHPSEDPAGVSYSNNGGLLSKLLVKALERNS